MIVGIKKSIIILSDTMAGFLSLLVLMLFSFDILEVKHLYIINFLLGIGDAFQNPASEVVISIIVSKENYIKTSGIRSFFNSFITIFVPICSVAIYSFSGLKYILIVDLLTFLFALLTLIFLVYIPEIKSLKEEKVHGNIYVTGNTVIDALHMVVEKLKNDVTLAAKQEQMLAKAGYDVARLADGKN